MNLYLKDGNTLIISDNLKLELLNCDEFVSAIKNASKMVPAPHFRATLRFKLVDHDKEYLGESVFDSYKVIKEGFNNTIDESSPYIVELNDWRLSDNDDKYLSFNITEKPKDYEVSNMLTEEAYKLLGLPMMLFPYGEIQFFGKENIDEMQKGFRNKPDTGEIYEEWAGKEYVLIGFDATAGCGPDLYILKTDDPKYPVYWLMTDGGDWEKPELICDSLEKFNRIMKLLNSYEDTIYNSGLDTLKKDEIYNHICEIMGTKDISFYWDSLLNRGLNDK